MSDNISDVVVVSTSLSAVSLSQAGFGVPLILGAAPNIAPDFVRSYRDADELIADGFSPTSAVYRAAAVAFAQDPTVELLKVGRLSTGLTNTVATLTPTVQNGGVYRGSINGVDFVATPARTYTPTVANDTVYTVTIGGVAYSVTSDASATAAEIISAGTPDLIELINADTATHGVTASGTTTLVLTSAPGFTPVITTTANLVVAANTATEISDAIRTAIQAGTQGGAYTETGTSTVVLTGTVAGDVPALEFGDNLTVQYTTAVQTSSGFATDMANILAQDGDWYGAVLTGLGKAQILEAAAYFDGTKKVLFAVTGDDDLVSTAYATGDDSTDDVATRLKNLGRTRTHLFFSRNPTRYPNAAIAAAALREQPGESTYALKQLVGISADTLSSTQSQRLLAKNVNFMMTAAGLAFTSNNGVMSNGVFADIRVLVDYFEARIQERVLRALLTAKKIPQTDEGISIIRTTILAFLRSEEFAGHAIRGSSAVTAPKRADIDQADLNARLLDNVRYSTTASGAIHKVVIRGVVNQ